MALPPLTRTLLNLATPKPLPGIRAVTRPLLYCRILATWRQAELGFLGLMVQTRTTRPRPWGHCRRRGVRERGGLARRVERGRAHWEIVAISPHGMPVGRCGAPELHRGGRGMSPLVA